MNLWIIPSPPKKKKIDFLSCLMWLSIAHNIHLIYWFYISEIHCSWLWEFATSYNGRSGCSSCSKCARFTFYLYFSFNTGLLPYLYYFLKQKKKLMPKSEADQTGNIPRYIQEVILFLLSLYCWSVAKGGRWYACI